MSIAVKRVYERSSEQDGARILVDRLWPRGVIKKAAHIDSWEKDLAPSNELRKWFHEDKQKRFDSFSKKYRSELKKQQESLQRLKMLTKKGRVTLVTAVKDIEHSHLPVLLKALNT